MYHNVYGKWSNIWEEESEEEEEGGIYQPTFGSMK